MNRCYLWETLGMDLDELCMQLAQLMWLCSVLVIVYTYTENRQEHSLGLDPKALCIPDEGTRM